MRPIVEVEGLSKSYIISHQQKAAYGSLREDLVSLLKRSLQPHISYSNRETFWALQDVGFEVERGEVLGIIGRNGSGKSTLLKILSRIVDPTRGRAVIRGRVASLLEVGTGFHPELTGRENIFLNGAILGIRRREIARRFEEIVDFSGVEQFIDTPVKFYSSGMYVRLAFAVAAHLEPEVLIVDEVLAVGDAEFQNKSLGKMNAVAREGRTVLFVSHNMASIERLCTVAIHLERGKTVGAGKDVGSIVRNYLNLSTFEVTPDYWRNEGEIENDVLVPHRVYLNDLEGRRIDPPVPNSSGVNLVIEADVLKPSVDLKMGYSIYNQDGTLLYVSEHTDAPQSEWPELTKGHYVFSSVIPAHLLNEGKYRIELFASVHGKRMLMGFGFPSPAVLLTIQGGLSESPYFQERREGILAPLMQWEVEKTG